MTRDTELNQETKMKRLLIGTIRNAYLITNADPIDSQSVRYNGNRLIASDPLAALYLQRHGPNALSRSAIKESRQRLIDQYLVRNGFDPQYVETFRIGFDGRVKLKGDSFGFQTTPLGYQDGVRARRILMPNVPTNRKPRIRHSVPSPLAHRLRRLFNVMA